MPRVTINGDDFGMNESCTKAILRALREGWITDTTMMANGSFFDEAIQMAKEFGMTDRIGVHFNLTEGRPLTEGITKAPLFVKDGVFHRAFLHRPRELNEVERQAVFAELAPQLGVDRETALKISACFGGGMWVGETCGAVVGAIIYTRASARDRRADR